MSVRESWLLALAVTACTRASPDPIRTEAAAAGERVAAPTAVSVTDAASDGPSPGVAVAKAVMPTAPMRGMPAPERMIVRTAELSMQVGDVHRVTQQIADATVAAHGFLGTSRLWRDGERDRATMVVRVPAAVLDATLATLRAMAVRVDDESVSGEDVTRQAVDLNAHQSARNRG